MLRPVLQHGESKPTKRDVSIHLTQVTSDARSSLGFACVNPSAHIHSTEHPDNSVIEKVLYVKNTEMFYYVFFSMGL